MLLSPKLYFLASTLLEREPRLSRLLSCSTSLLAFFVSTTFLLLSEARMPLFLLESRLFPILSYKFKSFISVLWSSAVAALSLLLGRARAFMSDSDFIRAEAGSIIKDNASPCSSFTLPLDSCIFYTELLLLFSPSGIRTVVPWLKTSPIASDLLIYCSVFHLAVSLGLICIAY